MTDTPIEVLLELLRLYDWRKELGREELALRDGLIPSGKQRRADALAKNLRRYGREKAAAWERARKVIEAASNPCGACGHGAKRHYTLDGTTYCYGCREDKNHDGFHDYVEAASAGAEERIDACALEIWHLYHDDGTFMPAAHAVASIIRRHFSDVAAPSESAPAEERVCTCSHPRSDHPDDEGCEYVVGYDDEGEDEAPAPCVCACDEFRASPADPQPEDGDMHIVRPPHRQSVPMKVKFDYEPSRKPRTIADDDEPAAQPEAPSVPMEECPICGSDDNLHDARPHEASERGIE